MIEKNLKNICQKIRRLILTSTTMAQSGHPTSSLSAVELMTVLFFSGFFNEKNDEVIFSKGHAAPLLYALYAVLGKIDEKKLETLRQFGSVLEGHPTPRFPYVKVATGSLGQGLSIGLGMALAKRFLKNKGRVFVLLGDSEISEGQVWEAVQLASYYKTDNLIAIIDINRLGQRGQTMLGWDLLSYQKRFESFSWKTFLVFDGHNLDEIKKVYQEALLSIEKKPKVILAKTIKGKGVSFLEDKDGWHGKALSKDELEKALEELEQNQGEKIFEKDSVEKKSFTDQSQKSEEIKNLLRKLNHYF
jgi:transketolase